MPARSEKHPENPRHFTSSPQTRKARNFLHILSTTKCFEKDRIYLLYGEILCGEGVVHRLVYRQALGGTYPAEHRPKLLRRLSGQEFWIRCDMSAAANLRLLCNQIASSTPGHLLSTAGHLQERLIKSGELFNLHDGSNSKSDNSEAAVLVHKLKTQVSSLLHGKSPENRFVAAVLIKALVDVGGWEVLKGVEPWVRGLQGIITVSSRLLL
jgi:hypothetical protein